MSSKGSNRSRVEGNKRTEAHGAAKIPPGCVGRCDRRAERDFSAVGRRPIRQGRSTVAGDLLVLAGEQLSTSTVSNAASVRLVIPMIFHEPVHSREQRPRVATNAKAEFGQFAISRLFQPFDQHLNFDASQRQIGRKKAGNGPAPPSGQRGMIELQQADGSTRRLVQAVNPRDFLRCGGQARTVSPVDVTAVRGSQLTYCVEVADELLADVEEQTVRSVHQAQRLGRESPESPHSRRTEIGSRTQVVAG